MGKDKLEYDTWDFNEHCFIQYHTEKSGDPLDAELRINPHCSIRWVYKKCPALSEALKAYDSECSVNIREYRRIAQTERTAMIELKGAFRKAKMAEQACAEQAVEPKAAG